MERICLDKINHFVLSKQHLAANTKSDDVVQIVRDVAGLHATISTTPYLSLYARSPRFEKTDLDKELYEKHSLGKIRCVRKTIYVHAADVLPVAFSATVNKVARASGRFTESRGVSPQAYEEISKAILALLESKEMTAPAIKAALGTKLDVSSILYFMCDQGLLSRGRPKSGWKDNRHHYALFGRHFPGVDLKKMSEEKAITALVKRYLAAFGPVKENDVVWWMGLGKTKARAALKNLQDRVRQVAISGIEGDFFVLCSDEALIKDVEPPDEPTVNLLPALDPYLMGYKERERYLGDHVQVFDRSGNVTSTILVCGKIVGVWDFQDDDEPLVKLFFLEKISQHALDKVYTSAQRLGRFIADHKVGIKECDAMLPLTERPAGSFMSPLKGQV